jgi:hypothetical protein
MELFGRIVHAMEFGVPRQKIFVCVKPKVMHNARCVTRAEDSFAFPKGPKDQNLRYYGENQRWGSAFGYA